MAPEAIIPTANQCSSDSFSPRKTTPKIATSHDGQLVDRGDAGGIPQLQRPEIGGPRSTGRKAGEAEKQPGPAGNRQRRLPLPGDDDDDREHHKDDAGADQGRQIGGHAGDADLGENRRQRRKGGRKQRPEGPALHHQNSTPACALMPERKGCLSNSISVARSAISISSSLALRPVRTTWVM